MGSNKIVKLMFHKDTMSLFILRVITILGIGYMISGLLNQVDLLNQGIGLMILSGLCLLISFVSRDDKLVTVGKSKTGSDDDVILSQNPMAHAIKLSGFIFLIMGYFVQYV